MSTKLIETYTQRHEQFLEHILNETIIPADQIRSAMNYALFPGGKRIRPTFVYLAGALIDIDLHVLDVIAVALELTHCYSLIHDDLPAMDDDDMRRGKPSCHIAFDEATAILTGDGMQALAVEVLLSRLPAFLPPERVIALTQILVKASGVSGMVSGQSLDLSELAKPSVTKEQLGEIHQLKTGQLISACFEMILVANGPTFDQYEAALETYAHHIGLVFQMQDDYLDHYAPADVLGKSRSSDSANQKTTFATLLTKEQLEKEIAVHYQIASGSLQLFDQKAIHLIEFTQLLQQRSKLKVYR